MKLPQDISSSGFRYIRKWPGIFALTIFLSLISSLSIAQLNSTASNRDSSKSISLSSFDSLVDRSIILLKSKELSEIADSDQITIMMCLNTIIFSIKKPAFDDRFTGDRYQGLIKISGKTDYLRNITKVYSDWIPNRGMGFYFPKLRMEVYGTPLPYAIFDVRYFEEGSVKLFDSTTGNIFVLDTKHVCISAFDKNGTILWKTDPHKDGNLANYRVANPKIVNFELGWTHECSWCGIPGNSRVIWIEYDNSQIGFLDLSSGKFHFCGQS
jgi:hypothetical protein